MGFGRASKQSQRAILQVLYRRSCPLGTILLAMTTQHPQADRNAAEPHRPAWHAYAWTIAAVVLATLAATPLLSTLALANIVMLFLLVVVIAAYLFGRGPAVVAAVSGVAAFDFFFVPPRFSFAVADAQYLLTFVVMLVTGLVIAHLTSQLRLEAAQARERGRRSHELYEMARTLSAAIANEQIIESSAQFFASGFKAKSLILLRDGRGELVRHEQTETAKIDFDANVARAVFVHDIDADARVRIIETGGLLYLALKAPGQTLGVLVLAPVNAATVAGQEQRLQLETCAVLIAIALERVYLVNLAREATLQMEGERLRSTLLSALSHDLRTPLTAIFGAAESMRLNAASLPPGHVALIDAVREQASRTVELVEKILDMARLESGVHLRREWESLEEIVGAALSVRAALLSAHVVEVSLPADLPLIECDATLMERVLVNLLENAAKYTPPGSAIRISARIENAMLRVDVIDSGPGIPRGREATIFDKFERGDAASSIPGLGLGLAICRVVIEVHGGRIWVERSTEGGADFAFTLPLGVPPADADESGDGEQP